MNEIVTIPFIVLVSYILGELFKVLVKNKKELNKLISLIPALVGCIVALIMYLDDPKILGVNNIYVAMELGIISGASASSTNEIIKKIFKKERGGNTNEN